MSRVRDLLNNPTEPVPRAVSLRVGTGVAIVIAALMGWATFKYAATGDLSEAEISDGIDDFARGGYHSAEEHFIDAASVSILDAYPAFLIRTTRRMRGQIADPPDAQDQIAQALLDGDIARADQLVAELREASPRAAQYWERLLAELRARAD